MVKSLSETDVSQDEDWSENIPDLHPNPEVIHADRETFQFGNLTDEHRRARYTSWNLGWYSDGIQGLTIRALEIVVLVMSVRYWLKGILTLGDFVLLRSYLSQLTEQVRSMGGNVRRIYEAMADANEMTEILLIPHGQKTHPQMNSISCHG